jgi:hypothetical protein
VLIRKVSVFLHATFHTLDRYAQVKKQQNLHRTFRIDLDIKASDLVTS